MANRKEDEKNERIIRNLLKLPDNRRCINCNSLGPQYACTNFWTFVCTNCSGIHREFTHRVKSISMAKFTSQEVSALQGGGNASAKEIYFKEWDPQRQSLPDGSKVDRLRDFIKHVYVERRYTGERSFNDRRADSSQTGSRSPPYDDSKERHYSDRQSSGERSPGYDQENRQYGDSKRSPARTEMVNDWRREDRFGNGKRSEDSRTSDGDSRIDVKSPDRQRDLEASSPPAVRPVRDILGENITPLRVIEPPKANGARSTDGSVQTQRTASSSSLASSNGNPAELRTETSLIDFDSIPEPAVSALVLQQAAAAGTPVAQAASPGSDNWANFDSMVEVKVPQAPANTNPLESVLFELSVPASVSGGSVGTTGSSSTPTMPSAGNTSAFISNLPVAPLGFPFVNVQPAATAVNNLAAFPTGIAAGDSGPISLQPVPGGNLFGNTPIAGQWSQPQQHSLFPAVGGQGLSQPYNSAVGPSGSQPWNQVLAQNSLGLPSAATMQIAQQGVKPSTEVGLGVATENNSGQIKSGGRKEFPVDLFAFNYSSISAQVPSWHTGPPQGMGFHMQNNTLTPVPSFPQASKSTNPFDVNSDPSPAPTFPSMSSLQGALPAMNAPGGDLLRTSSLGAPAPHPSALHPHVPPYGAMLPSNAFMAQQLPGNMASRPQVNFGTEAPAFGPLNSYQQLGGLQSASTTQNIFPSIGGNPFG